MEKRGQRLCHCVAHLIVPERKVIDLHSADTQQDSQDFKIGGLERQDRIKARSTLFDESEMNGGNVGNGLDSGLRAIVLQRNGGLVDDIQELRIPRPQVWILRAAVAEIPTGVYGERLQVGQTSAAKSTGHFRELKSFKLLEVDWL